jgi:RimJ/RimL family protein N-acetyltransferase
VVTSVETARLHLRPWREDDFPELVRLYSDPEVMRYISRGWPLTRDRVRGIPDKQLRHWREHGFGPWIRSKLVGSSSQPGMHWIG